MRSMQWKIISGCLLIAWGSTFTSAQNVVNWGLTHPQPVETLPKSKVAIVPVVRKLKMTKQTILNKVSDNDYVLSQGWELAEGAKVIASPKPIFDSSLDTKEWYNATVPGTVLTTLVEQGIYPNPYFGLNNLSIPDSLCRMDWWYRIPFKIPAEQVDKAVWLLFNGVNYKAEVWLNGQQVGNIHGAFTRGEFNVSRFIKVGGENVLAVHILPPPNPGIPQEQSILGGNGMNGGQLCLDGPTFISSEGWDWVPGIRDRNIGLWQDVHLRFTGDIKLNDTQVISDLQLPDTTRANIIVRSELENISLEPKEIVINLDLEGIKVSKKIKIGARERTKISFTPDEFPALTIKNPRLWWPNNYGRQELYRLNVTVVDNSHRISDTKSVRFGIRELTYEMEVCYPNDSIHRIEYNPTMALKRGKPIFDNIHRKYIEGGMCMPRLRKDADPNLLIQAPDSAMEHYLVIKVNGKRIFCRGGNWGMDDGMKRVSRERLEPYFRLHKDANLNMIRNWTGESTEETFYELCDEYGMLVFNDFWLTTEGYNLGINDDNLFLENAKDVVLRYRNHPSIAVWNPRNEGFAPAYIEEKLSAMIAKEDGTRHYNPNSTHSNLRPSGPWNYFKDPADYYRNNAHGFNTEQGTTSIPTSESILGMMSKEDAWPIGDVWYYHDLHGGQNDFVQAVKTKYGESDNLEDFCKKSQLVNYDSHRAMFEAWNSKMWNSTSGLLLWMTHPAWPSTVWQIYSWDYETFGSFYGSRKACEPVHVQKNLNDNEIVVINTTLKSFRGAGIDYKIYSLSGKLLFTKEVKRDIAANRLTECFTPQEIKSLPDVYLERLILTDVKGKQISTNDYWKCSENKNFLSFNQLADVPLKGRIVKCLKNGVEVELTNESNTPAVGIKLNARDADSGERILPAYFTDGYMNLLPGEKRRFVAEYQYGKESVVTAEGYNVPRHTIVTVKK
ncbi:sugar-binding domain-containing protein [uncultured Bacteroides sp.]|uniref:glycoside hydrolase family 2 protein n=1 Tax=uncultured Bacteroides sp. TaxID=162156 RepID=UPI002AA7C57E|nr:sugar-binding domain-containing protein [uncultured Bacteroides sp.]